MVLTKQRQSLYINGEWLATSSSEAVIDPANGSVFAEAPVANADHVEAALSAAREAFDTGPWPKMSQKTRQAKVAEFLDAIERRAGDIVPLIIEESGSLQMLAQFMQFSLPLQQSRYLLEVANRPAVTPLPVDVVPNMQGTHSLASAVLSREPVGVVVAITPYNVPFLTNVCKSAAAMLVGCTVILKPSPYTPFEALVLGEIADEVGLPKGVLNVVNGGVDVGTRLTSDKRVDMITFTGSDRVGAAIQAQAAPTLKRVVLELGGKSALIVCADADISKAASAGFGGITTHCGQGCVLLTRHLVHNSIRQKYVSTLTEMLAGVKIGDPNDASTTMGPLIREDARARTERYVDIAKSEGARLVTGGRRPPHLKQGFYYEPTLFDDVSNNSRIAQEEVFGPLAVVIGFDTEEEAISLANDTDYGLSGAVYSANIGRAYEIALQMRTGGVTVNTGFAQLTRNAPFGGIKRSGHGREYGEIGLNEFTYVKTVDFTTT
jgi:acyl-CoA reductase-like NAD-dependent aldehyde dehydrogenase